MFRALGQWSTSGALPAEFVKCLSAEEACSRLASGRPFSALVADAELQTLDRDLLATASPNTVYLVPEAPSTARWRSAIPVVVGE